MNKRSIDRHIQIRKDLLEREQVLLEEVAAARNRPLQEGAQNVSDPRGDDGDHAAAMLSEDLRVLEAERDLAELAEIQQALERIDRGTYGICTQCGAEIAGERLAAQPASGHCIDCQRRHERTHWQQSGSSL